MAKSILQRLQESTDEVISIIYEKVNGLLGAGNQLFVMEFPSRPLNSKDFEYDTDDCYSVLTKPYPVQENEFLLSDEMFDVSPVVQGPNGEKLSTVYSTVLNNFVPRLEELKSFVNDQKNLRRWLMEKVNDEIDGEQKEISRMGLSKELYRQYLEKRNEWYSEKDKKYDELKEGEDLNGYARWVSSTGLVREEDINNYYNDAVVRGNYHEVLTLLGFLNVSSPSEVLEQTKQKIRASVRRSLDGSSDIYPVQFQPSDWFKALRPNLSPKDLTMATESLLADYRAKKARLRSLEALLAEQAVIEIPVEKQKELSDNIERHEKSLSDAELNMIKKYGSGAVSAVRAVVNIYKEVSNPLEKAKTIMSGIQQAGEGSFNAEQKNIYALIEGLSKDVIDGIVDTFEGQQKVSHELKKLTDARMAFSEAKVKDMRLHKIRIEEQIKTVQADLDFLTPLVTGTLSEISKDKNAENADAPLMTADTEDVEDNNFIDVVIKSSEHESLSSNTSASTSSHKSWNVGGWFWSASGRSESSSSSESQERLETSEKVEIGFRIKKVTINRGGWFNPNILKLSNNYFRLADIRYSRGLHKDQVQEVFSKGENVTENLNKLVTYNVDGKKEKLDYVLSAFPIGFVIAKDITIRIEANKDEQKSNREYMESNQNSSGGFLCFRTNSSNSSKSQSESAYFGGSENFFYIRIPGPQILGWFLEFTPSDNAMPYQELDPALYAKALESLVPEIDSKIGE
ncbi:MAG: hypothetical protein LBU88_03785 [Treponema sp.]|jgi:hypothetical protein|nr:hypothetical protein [Treponema sp.]